MLRLSISTEEWLKIGEDINIVFLEMTENKVKIMIDAPKEIPVSRSRAREKYLSQADYKKEQAALERKVNAEKAGDYIKGEEMELSLWIREGDRKHAVYGIFGKGKLARECYNTILAGGTQRILTYVNTQRAGTDQNIPVNEEETLKNPELDYIIVAVPDAKGYKGFENKLRGMGIPKEKIVWISHV